MKASPKVPEMASPKIPEKAMPFRTVPVPLRAKPSGEAPWILPCRPLCFCSTFKNHIALSWRGYILIWTLGGAFFLCVCRFLLICVFCVFYFFACTLLAQLQRRQWEPSAASKIRFFERGPCVTSNICATRLRAWAGASGPRFHTAS